MGKRGRQLAAAAAILAIIVGAMLATRSGSSGGDGKTAPGLAADAGAAGRDLPQARAPGPERNLPPPGMPTGDPAIDFDNRELLANYLELTRFPPNSRPLGAEQIDLLAPNSRHEGSVPVTTPRVGDTPDPEGTYYVLFTGDRFFITGDEPIHTSLRVWKGVAGSAGEPVTIQAATVSALTPAGEQEIATLTYRPERGKDGVTYRSSFAPAKAGATHTGDYRIDLFFTAPDGTEAQGRLDFFFTPPGTVPARFTGKFRDRIENGSLVVSVELAVTSPGRYDLDANLFDAADRPVASARYIGELTAGKHWADLQFWGLIFHDKQASGRFTLRNLRGHRFMPGENPDRLIVPSYPGSHRTASYALDVFSNAEWDSPDKQQQIEIYQRLIDEQDRGAP